MQGCGCGCVCVYLGQQQHPLLQPADQGVLRLPLLLLFQGFAALLGRLALQLGLGAVHATHPGTQTDGRDGLVRTNGRDYWWDYWTPEVCQVLHFDAFKPNGPDCIYQCALYDALVCSVCRAGNEHIP